MPFSVIVFTAQDHCFPAVSFQVFCFRHFIRKACRSQLQGIFLIQQCRTVDSEYSVRNSNIRKPYRIGPMPVFLFLRRKPRCSVKNTAAVSVPVNSVDIICLLQESPAQDIVSGFASVFQCIFPWRITAEFQPAVIPAFTPFVLRKRHFPCTQDNRTAVRMITDRNTRFMQNLFIYSGNPPAVFTLSGLPKWVILRQCKAKKYQHHPVRGFRA